VKGQFKEMQDYVFSILTENLPKNYSYHNLDHTREVMEKVIEIGKHEGCTTEELDLLLAAALWHDAGYIHIYTGHEEESCRMAKEQLPSFGYTATEIKAILGMILATRTPQQPENKLEEIIADADLDYLGTDEVVVKAKRLYNELHSLNSKLTPEEWREEEIRFLKEHRYFTSFSKKYRQQNQRRYLESLLSRS
jgi:uncharacterized protein